MEDLTVNAIEWAFKLGTGGGFVALLWMTIRFFGSSQKDATDAALALYKLVKAERDEFARELADLRGEIKALRSELETERLARKGLERELAAQGNAAAYLISRKPVDKS